MPGHETVTSHGFDGPFFLIFLPGWQAQVPRHRERRMDSPPSLFFHYFMGAHSVVVPPPDSLQRGENATRLGRWPDTHAAMSKVALAESGGNSARAMRSIKISRAADWARSVASCFESPYSRMFSSGTSAIQRPSASRSNSIVSFITSAYHRKHRGLPFVFDEFQLCGSPRRGRGECKVGKGLCLYQACRDHNISGSR